MVNPNVPSDSGRGSSSNAGAQSVRNTKSPKSKTDWDTYFLDLARQSATRSSCTQSKHGAVIVAKRHIRSTGYNGTPSGYPNCDEGGCPRGKNGDPEKHCWGLHAEANAILYSDGEDREGATLYLTTPPCLECAKLIANSGVREVVAPHGTGEGLEKVKRFLLDCKVRVRFLRG